MAATLVQCIEFVNVETDPAVWHPTTDDSGLDIPHLLPEWHTLPERYAAVLEDLIEADPSDPAKCVTCLSGVGYVEAAREDTYGRDIDTVEWRWVTLASSHEDGPVVVQCEECAPVIVTTAAVAGSR